MGTRRVLIIEDNEANMELAADLMELAGYSVIRAPSAEDGIVVARTAAPDIILMDLTLPGMDGLRAAQILREDPLTREIPVIALTSRATKGDRQIAIGAGFRGYITKPIDTRRLADKVAQHLSCREEVRA